MGSRITTTTAHGGGSPDTPKPGETVITPTNGGSGTLQTTLTASGLRVESAGLTIDLASASGTEMRSDPSGRLVMSGRGEFAVRQSGLQPGSTVVIRLRPTNQQLVIATVAADGTLTVDVVLPEGLADGDYALQIDMVKANGEAVSMSTGFAMNAASTLGAVLRVGGSLTLAAVVFAAAFFWLLAWRRRDDELSSTERR